MRRYTDINDGDEFGRLTVRGTPFKKTEGVAPSNYNRYHVHVECSCGTKKDVPLANLLWGTSSCGCYRSELKQKGTFAKDGQKKCAHCKETKSVDHFSKNVRCKDGLNPHCKRCDSHKRVQLLYGMQPEEYEALLEAQDYRCALCRRKPHKRRLAVDHCHVTGRVRGLLCIECNTLAGRLGDDAHHVQEFVGRLLDYLGPSAILQQEVAIRELQAKCIATQGTEEFSRHCATLMESTAIFSQPDNCSAKG